MVSTTVHRYPSCSDLEFMASVSIHMGGCQNYNPFWGTLSIMCRIRIGTLKGTIILTATHIVKAPEQLTFHRGDSDSMSQVDWSLDLVGEV